MNDIMHSWQAETPFTIKGIEIEALLNFLTHELENEPEAARIIGIYELKNMLLKHIEDGVKTGDVQVVKQPKAETPIPNTPIIDAPVTVLNGEFSKRD